MLIEFSVANFRSFQKMVTLSLECEPRLSERDKSVDERNVLQTPSGDLLRVIGIYGANASGKSNIVRALSTLRGLVLHSAQGQESDLLPAEPFLLDPNATPSACELELVYMEEGRQVRYGVEFTTQRVLREWLFVRPLETETELLWYERTYDATTDVDIYRTGEDWARSETYEKATRRNALHLSTASLLNHSQAKVILSWFRNLRVINGLDHERLLLDTTKLLEHPILGDAIQRLVQRLDFGVDKIELLTVEDEQKDMMQRIMSAISTAMPSGIQPLKFEVSEKHISTERRGVRFNLRDESAGTIRAVALAGPIIEALAGGHTIVIDEFDSRLHTLLAKELIEQFQDTSINRHNSQLIFVSHDTNLLTRTLLRRDQLWFVEKSHKSQTSVLYSLSEIRLAKGKKVRNDAHYEDDYLQGRYGAIPFFGGLSASLREALTAGQSE